MVSRTRFPRRSISEREIPANEAIREKEEEGVKNEPEHVEAFYLNELANSSRGRGSAVIENVPAENADRWSESVSRILFPPLTRRMAIIHLVPALPPGSSDLPGDASSREARNSNGPPEIVSLFGLAPQGVCLALDVTTETGGPLPHRFTIAHLRE